MTQPNRLPSSVRRSSLATALLATLGFAGVGAQSSAPADPSPLSARQVVERSGRAVVMIETEGEGQGWQAIDSQPRMADAHYLLGEIHLDRREFNQAKKAFEWALWEDENHALGHFGLAKLHTITDRTPPLDRPSPHGAASHHWEEFMRLSEGDPSLTKARQIAVRILEEYFPHLLDR